MYFHILPLARVGIYRGPSGLKWRHGSGFDIRWSLKDFGNDIPVGIVAVENKIQLPKLNLRDFGIDTRWIDRAESEPEKLRRILGVAFAMQAGIDRPDLWLGREIHFGFGMLAPFDRQMYLAEQESLLSQIIEPLRVRWQRERPRFDWRLALRQMALTPLALLMGALPATDVFTGSDGTALTTYSANWTLNTGDFYIQSNAIASNVGSANEAGAYWDADTFANDQYAQGSIVAAAAGAEIGLAVRAAASGASYYGFYNGDGGRLLFKMVAGTWTQLGTTGAELAATTAIRLEVTGTSVRPMVSGATDSTIGTQTDSALASGSAGISGWSTGTGNRLDSWEGGNLGGTGYTQSVSGGITPSGAASKQAAKPLTGAVSSIVGTIARQANKVTAGAVSSIVGTVVRLTGKALAGGVTPSGAISKLTSKILAGAISTIEGTLETVRLFAISLSGGITPSGGITKQTNKLPAGALTPSGAVSKQVGKIVAGAISTIEGTLETIRLFVIAVSGGITPAGTISRQTNKTPGGALTPSGAIARLTAKLFAGGVTPSGDSTKQTAKSAGGSIESSGTETRETQKALTGSITLAGGITRAIQKVVTGTLTAAGGISRVISKSFSGALSMVGTLAAAIAGAVVGVKGTASIGDATSHSASISVQSIHAANPSDSATGSASVGDT